MAFSSIIMLPLLLLFLAIWAGLIYLLILLIRALRKYLRGGEARREKAETRRTLGEVLKAHRMRCQMTRSSWRRPWGSAGRRSANGRPARRTPAPPTCWPWRSSSVCQRRSCCIRRPAGEYETIGIKGQRYKSGGEKPSLRSVRAHWARLYENGPASCEAGPCTKHFGFNKSGCLGAQLFSNIHLFTRSVL